MSLLTSLIALLVGAIVIVLVMRGFMFLMKPLIHCFIFGCLAMVHPFLGGVYLAYMAYLLLLWIVKKLSS